MVVFLSVVENNYSCTLSVFFVVFGHMLEAFTHNSKELSSREKFS